ncbi:MAG: hypothetical protein GX576_14615 [Thauera phenolivorans]|uniref:Uncharacterized protein n=1 Tax=Thauera phenolivorans TaxID=1792543 RepID=A0A7X7LYQ0_9RHOO|nr:hypothetical protein [Thauera phenolivorans]NLF55599.1 hypothetical protein [Thauera phenolivorans]
MNDTERLLTVIEALRAEVRSLGERVAGLETQLVAAPNARSPAAAGVAGEGPTEEELLAISAAIAAFLGCRAKIRQVRLVRSATWAQVGRVNIQASHHVH